MKLDPQSLRLFISVLEEGTIAAASQREHIAAAAVSRRLSELESLLGSQLLIRSNKGIEPTEAGTALMYMARGVLNDLSGIVSEMQEYSHGKRGSVPARQYFRDYPVFARTPEIVHGKAPEYPGDP